MERSGVSNNTLTQPTPLLVECHTPTLSVTDSIQRNNSMPIYPAGQPQFQCFPSGFQTVTARDDVVPSDTIQRSIPPVSATSRDAVELERFSVSPDVQLSPIAPPSSVLPPTMDSFPTTAFAAEQPPLDALKPHTQHHRQAAHYSTQIPFFEASTQPLNAETVSPMGPLSTAMDSTQPSFYFDSPPVHVPNACITTRPSDLFKSSPRSDNNHKVQQSFAKIPLTSEYGTLPQYHCDRSTPWEQLTNNNSHPARKTCDVTPLSALCETAAKENSMLQATPCGQNENIHLVSNPSIYNSNARPGATLYNKHDASVKGKITTPMERENSSIPSQHMPLRDIPSTQAPNGDHIAPSFPQNNLSSNLTIPRSSILELSADTSKADSNQKNDSKKDQDPSPARDSPTAVLPNARDGRQTVHQNTIADQVDNRKIEFKQGQLPISHQSTVLRPFRCEFPGCYKTFDRQYSLTSHNRVHTDSMPYICKVAGCTQRFKWRSSQAHHMRKKHVGMSILMGRGVNKRYIILGQENLSHAVTLSDAKRSSASKSPSDKTPENRCSASVSADHYSKSSEISPLAASSSKESVVDQQRRVSSLSVTESRLADGSVNEAQ